MHRCATHGRHADVYSEVLPVEGRWEISCNAGRIDTLWSSHYGVLIRLRLVSLERVLVALVQGVFAFMVANESAIDSPGYHRCVYSYILTLMLVNMLR